MRIELDLPELTNDERAHSARLAHIIIDKIKDRGFMPFSEYFADCLYHPELGYYTGSLQKFGEKGDFVTAPMISPLFSYCFANQIAEVLKACVNPLILEIGAGLGVMAADIITRLKAIDALPNRYCIVEISPSLRQKQHKYLAEQHPDYIEHIIWLDEAPEKPWQGCIIGNEIVDALPVERFIIKDGKPYYADVTYDEQTQKFVTYSERQDQVLTAFIANLTKEGIYLPDGYMSEFCSSLHDWINNLSASLEKGALLLADYGYSRKQYYARERVEGTLIAHIKHRVHNGWDIYQGMQDLTANVDFTYLAEAGMDNHLDFLGYTTQAYFLYGNQLEEMLLKLKGAVSDAEWFKIAQAMQLLVLPTEMGERFKVLGLGRNLAMELQGFTLYDASYQL